MTKIPNIQVDNLTLRLAEQADLIEILLYWSKNKNRLMQHGPEWPANFLSKEFWQNQIEKQRIEFEKDISLRMFLYFQDKIPNNEMPKDKARVIGHINFGGIIRSVAQFCYLGYGIDKDFEGKGYMSQILPKAIEFVFTELNIHRIMANYEPNNIRSANLLARLGFEKEGYAKNYLLLNGTWKDHILTSLTNSKWQIPNNI